MASSPDGIARRFLAEPSYNKVFKHTCDVIEDYVCYFLTGIGALALSVRFLSTLGSGQVSCLIAGVQNATDDNMFGPYPVGSGAAGAMVAYANFDQNCVDRALSKYMQFLPFILILQTLILILVEKFLLNIPKVSGKIERFYQNVVEDSLFGKDPDIAEDVTDEKVNIDAISRRRRRNEVCISLKRSSIIYQVYIVKNIVELLLVLAFIPWNIFHAVTQPNEPASCSIAMKEFPELGLESGHIYYQCRGKKLVFFLILLWVHTLFLGLHLMCSAGSLAWATVSRRITTLLTKMNINQMTKSPIVRSSEETLIRTDDNEEIPLKEDVETCSLMQHNGEECNGEDFYFLFDLLAHNSGIEATLRVLTHADETFQKICMPNIESDQVQRHAKNIKVQEDKLQVFWKPSEIEIWLQKNDYKNIKVDSYVVTIFPAEMMTNSKTVRTDKKYLKNEDDTMYKAEFIDLKGGTVEYVVTIACVIGQSRMKGNKIVTTLVPYGPERPRDGIVKHCSTDQALIAWEKPNGDFGKYVLTEEKLKHEVINPSRQTSKMTQSFHDLPKLLSNFLPFNHHQYEGYTIEEDKTSDFDVRSIYDSETRKHELSPMVTEYTCYGLSPGEVYYVELKTKTGIVFTRRPISQTFLTKPLPVESLKVSEIGTNKAELTWRPPENHAYLRTFNLYFKHKPENGIHLYKHISSYRLEELIELTPATSYTVILETVCLYKELKSISEKKEVTFSTLPNPPTNLVLEHRECNSLTVKWDPSIHSTNTKHRTRLTIYAPNINYQPSPFDVKTNITSHNFSKLPKIIGSGEDYTIKIEYWFKPSDDKDAKPVFSEPITATFKTKPLPPTNFKLGSSGNEITWTKSLTPNVNFYRVRMDRGRKEGDLDDEVRFEEEKVPSSANEELMEKFVMKKIVPDILYRINIFAIVHIAGGDPIESKALQANICQSVDENGEKTLTQHLSEEDVIDHHGKH